MIENLIYQEA